MAQLLDGSPAVAVRRLQPEAIEAGAEMDLMPTHKDMTAWLRKKGWTIYKSETGAIALESHMKFVPFGSIESAYRRLGGPFPGGVE